MRHANGQTQLTTCWPDNCVVAFHSGRNGKQDEEYSAGETEWIG